jgi:hypothetical protein
VAVAEGDSDRAPHLLTASGAEGPACRQKMWCEDPSRTDAADTCTFKAHTITFSARSAEKAIVLALEVHGSDVAGTEDVLLLTAKIRLVITLRRCNFSFCYNNPHWL